MIDKSFGDAGTSIFDFKSTLDLVFGAGLALDFTFTLNHLLSDMDGDTAFACVFGRVV